MITTREINELFFEVIKRQTLSKDKQTTLLNTKIVQTDNKAKDNATNFFELIKKQYNI